MPLASFHSFFWQEQVQPQGPQLMAAVKVLGPPILAILFAMASPLLGLGM